MATHKGITPMPGLLVHLAHVTQMRQQHLPWRHLQVPHACTAQPCPGLAIQHRWTLSSLVLTHTQHLAEVGWQCLLGLSCPRQLLLPACLPQQCSTVSYQDQDSWGTATPTPVPSWAVRAPSHPPNPCPWPLLPVPCPLQGAAGQADGYLWPFSPPAVAHSMAEGGLP